jgi:hypothetical protein
MLLQLSTGSLWTAESRAAESNAVEGSADDYLQEIKPLLRQKCVSCHGPVKQESGLRLDHGAAIAQGGDSGEVIDVAQPSVSLLVQRVVSHDESFRMPPEGKPLTAEQIERIKQWIVEGARFPEDEIVSRSASKHWAFQPLARNIIPPESHDAAAQHPIDAFVRERLIQAGLQFSPRAQPQALVRRLYLDLHGLPPTPEELQHWTARIAEPTSSQEAVEQLIDHLLDSPRYGERWGQHWLDVVRYADTHGFEVNTPRPHAWHYRDYVIAAFNEDKPYDEFIRDQLAGDATGSDAATGFLVAAPVLLPGQIGADDVSKRLARQDALDEIIVGTSATFLGLTVGCARCHDHKFDPISQRDYYAMQAFFAGVEYGDRAIVDDEAEQRAIESKRLEPQITELTGRLRTYEPLAFTGQTLIIDDEDLARVTLLKVKNGHGANPAGNQRGYKEDSGDADRTANLSGGRYTWFDNHPDQDVFTWNPASSGTFQIWISWGVHGSGVHTRDAQYWLDRDGNLETRDDQQRLGMADQYYFAGVTTGETEKVPMWSGLLDVGTFELQTNSRIVLRGGETGTGITADVIVLQEVGPELENNNAQRQPSLRVPVNASHNIERFAPIAAKFVRFTTFATIDDNRHEPCIDELEIFDAESQLNIARQNDSIRLTSSGNYSETGIHQLKHINDGQYGNSHSWISNQHGGGWIQLEFAEPQTIDRIEWGRDREGMFNDRLAIDYQIEVSLDGQTWTNVAGSADRVPLGTPIDQLQLLRQNLTGDSNVELEKLLTQLEKLQQRKTELDAPKLAYAGIFRAPDETYLLNRGDPEQRLEKIDAQVPTIFAAEILASATDAERRTALAHWIASSENPLTARVMANRIWLQHFGRGLVDTPSDFGLSGSLPSHPELLDWLANRFIESGWSVKSLQRLILTSQTYQQASLIDPHSQQIDGDNRLLWRFAPRRIEAEVLRDSMLQISGQLNLEMGGPGFDFFKSRGGLSGFPPVEQFGPEQLRRMIYAHKIRMESVPVFGVFDCPDAGQPAPQRSSSTTPIQALNLFNSPFVFDQSNAFAQRLTKEFPDSTDQQIRQAFLAALCREPSSAELDTAKIAVEQQGLDVLCRVLFNCNEFLFIP